MNKTNLDPGIDHLYAIKIIDDVHAKGGKVKGSHSHDGGLPFRLQVLLAILWCPP